MDPEILLKSAPLDYELCSLLGDKPSDFVVLCFNGVQFEAFGTPLDSPYARKDRQILVDHLNDRSNDSWWPDLFKNWGKEMLKQYGLSEGAKAEDFRPVVSWKIARVCAGHSSYLHCAIRLFEEERVSSLVKRWSVSGGVGAACVEIFSASGQYYDARGENLSIVIGQAVKRLLIAEG